MLKTRIGCLVCIIALNAQIFSAEVLNRFSQGDNLLFNQLDNGVMTLIYSCKNTPNHASFRVIVKRTVFDNVDQNISFFDNFDDCFSEEEFFPKDYAFIMRSLISSEQTIYALDTSLNDKRIDNFLSFCSKKIESALQEEFCEADNCCSNEAKSPIWMNRKEQNAYFLSHELDQLCPLMDPNQVIAIAIGDFELEEMSSLLNEKLSSETLFDEEYDDAQMIENDISTQQEAIRYWDHFLHTASLPTLSCASMNTQNNSVKVGSTYQNGVELYSKLPFSDDEKAIVIKIINTLADYNIFELAFHRGDLMKKGQKIRHVHPFRFIGLVFSDPVLKKNMEKISDSYFKWNGFIDGFSEKIEEEANKNNLVKYLPGLAEHLQIDYEQLAPFIHKRDWEELILFLINHRK